MGGDGDDDTENSTCGMLAFLLGVGTTDGPTIEMVGDCDIEALNVGTTDGSTATLDGWACGIFESVFGVGCIEGPTIPVVGIDVGPGVVPDE